VASAAKDRVKKLNALGHKLSRALLSKHRVRLIRWRRTRRDLSRLGRADVVFISYAKAGRTWTRVMISQLFQQKYGLPENQVIDDDNLHRLNPAVPRLLFTMGNYIADRHPVTSVPSPYASKKVIFLARHPVDTAVSFYFHLKNRVNPLLKDVKQVPDEKDDRGIFDHLQNSPVGLGHVIAYMNDWAVALGNCPQNLLLRYEDLRADPVPELERIAGFLGERFSPEQYRDAAEFASFNRLKERERENFFGNTKLQARDADNPDSFKVRRGKVGGYRDYLTPEQTAWVDATVARELNPMFGYGGGTPAAALA
jgi:hypothetical protein